MTGMPPQQQVSAQRLAMPDALRGFAIVSIMLLHNIEHFDLYFTPQGWPAWLTTLDKGVWNTLFFLFGGNWLWFLLIPVLCILLFGADDRGRRHRRDNGNRRGC